jgi:hypothetical protein
MLQSHYIQPIKLQEARVITKWFQCKVEFDSNFRVTIVTILFSK